MYAGIVDVKDDAQDAAMAARGAATEAQEKVDAVEPHKSASEVNFGRAEAAADEARRAAEDAEAAYALAKAAATADEARPHTRAAQDAHRRAVLAAGLATGYAQNVQDRQDDIDLEDMNEAKSGRRQDEGWRGGYGRQDGLR